MKPPLLLALLFSLTICGCASSKPAEKLEAIARPSPSVAVRPQAVIESEHAVPHTCGDGKKLSVHFYDVGQALSALITLPDGKHVLVDTGDSRNPTGVKHMLAELESDLHGAPLDVLLITHQHADHIGGAVQVLDAVPVLHYVDNGTGGHAHAGEPEAAEVRRTRAEAEARHVPVTFVDVDHRAAPLPTSPLYSIVPVLPSAWPVDCRIKPNDCSIGLRIDFCRSSILFTGDAESAEEQLLPAKAATLLQVGHHGSATSTHEAFLAEVHPAYAVISAGRPGIGTNATYCHPAENTVQRLDALLGDIDPARTIDAFYGASCRGADARRQWHQVPVSRRLFATEVDGDVLLETTGDGTFTQVSTSNSVASSRDVPTASCGAAPAPGTASNRAPR